MSKQIQEKFIERIDAVFLPVKDLKESMNWYQEIFGFKLLWENDRMCSLSIAPNCGFHLVQIVDFQPIDKYTPFNYVVKDIEKVRNMLKDKDITISPIRDGEPKRFDLTDINGNMISVIQL
ncbi:VOC family protein [Ornithinibacillus massiliensis]|uniref:VOC family protein n=1 Tax=Ornithinibacillus massiliensis TaxID=1944633 RepID=A0ABS5MCL6_9BACI|nr:VOC family protein [Ornithinibacillus massiliensis]MBS3679852.1 VOC family protein [Ornithinibacillus massiliensis]